MILLKKVDYNLWDEGNEEQEKKIFYKVLIKCSVLFVFIFILFVISLIHFDKVVLFSTLSWKLQKLILFFYLFVYIVQLVLLGSIVILTLFYRKKRKNWEPSYRLFLKSDIPSFVLNCFCILFFVMTFLLTPCNVSGDSMKNTFYNQDKLFCSGLGYKPKQNDVVVFDSSLYTGSKSGWYIKRVIAVEGDMVSYNPLTSDFYVNDEKIATLTEEQYKVLLNSTYLTDTLSFEIPKYKLIVFGDNRKISYDSRYFGLIDENKIIGKVIFRIYPFGNPKPQILE